MRHQSSRFDELYLRHAGQECYLFGCGISLKWMDLHQFADRPSILGNMLIHHKDVRALKAPYCTIIEPYFFYPIFPYRLPMIYPYRAGRYMRFLWNSAHREYRKAIRQNAETLFLINLSNYPVARFPNARYVSRWSVPPFEHRNSFRERTDAHQGTLKFQLSLAIYLGFKKAYLVGHDYTHFPSRAGHFFEKSDGKLNGTRYFCEDFINYASRYIDLVTVTLESGSETMNAVTYKDLTGQDPIFRENTEIVDRVKLENLAANFHSWQGFSIL